MQLSMSIRTICLLKISQKFTAQDWFFSSVTDCTSVDYVYPVAWLNCHPQKSWRRHKQWCQNDSGKVASTNRGCPKVSQRQRVMWLIIPFYYFVSSGTHCSFCTALTPLAVKATSQKFLSTFGAGLILGQCWPALVQYQASTKSLAGIFVYTTLSQPRLRNRQELCQW